MLLPHLVKPENTRHTLSLVHSIADEAIENNDPNKIRSALIAITNIQEHLTPKLNKAKDKWDRAYTNWLNNPPSEERSWKSRCLPPSLGRKPNSTMIAANISGRKAGEAFNVFSNLRDISNACDLTLKKLRKWEPPQTSL